MTSVDEALSYDRDAVGIGRKGTIDKPYLLKAPFWTVDTLFYAIPKSDIDLEFVHCSFLNVDWKSKNESTGLPSLSKEAINETIALVPSFNEQSQLGEFFNNLDSLITLHQRKCQYRGLYGYLSWEQRKLGDLYRSGDEKNERLEFNIDKTISVSTMTWNPGGNGAAAESLPLFKVLRYGDLAFEGNRTKGHPYGKLVVNDIGAGIMSSRFRTLAAKQTPCVSFWKYFLLNDATFRSIYINCTKRGTLMTELVVPELLQSSVLLPTEAEQSEIGTFFTQLDSLITLHQ